MLTSELEISSDAVEPDARASRPAAERAAIRAGTFNLANTILGAGMLGLPMAFSRCGMALGFVLLIVFAGLASLGLFLLSASCDIVGRPASFVTVSERAVRGSGILLSSAIAIKCFGVAVSYLVIVGDVMPQVLLGLGYTGQGDSVLLERRLWSLLAAVCVSPLAYLRDLHSLRHISLVAISCVLAIAVLIVLFSFRPPLSPAVDPCPAAASPLAGDGATTAGAGASGSTPTDGIISPRACRGPVVAVGNAVDTLVALPTFVFAFTCHQNIPVITNELRAACAAHGGSHHGPAQRRAGEATIILGAGAIAGLVYALVGGCGYSTFGDAVQGDVLRSYPASPLLAVARLAIAVIVTLSYPMQAHPGRECILAILDARAPACVACARTTTAGTADPAAPAGRALPPPDARGEREANDEAPPPEQPTSTSRLLPRRHRPVIITTLWLAGSILLSCAVDDLSLVLSLGACVHARPRRAR